MSVWLLNSFTWLKHNCKDCPKWDSIWGMRDSGCLIQRKRDVLFQVHRYCLELSWAEQRLGNHTKETTNNCDPGRWFSSISQVGRSWVGDNFVLTARESLHSWTTLSNLTGGKIHLEPSDTLKCGSKTEQSVLPACVKDQSLSSWQSNNSIQHSLTLTSSWKSEFPCKFVCTFWSRKRPTLRSCWGGKSSLLPPMIIRVTFQFF